MSPTAAFRKLVRVRMACTTITIGETGSPATKNVEHVTLTPLPSDHAPASSAPSGAAAAPVTLDLTDPASWGVAKVGTHYVVTLTEELAR